MTPTSLRLRPLLAASLLTLLAGSASAGTFAAITIDGNFSDWASVPALVTDVNEGFTKDINQIFIANDMSNVYIRITFNAATNPNDGSGLFLAFDNDSNSATGYDVYSLGLIGSEGAYQNDFPFEQATGVFNTGAANSAPIAISPYSVSTTSQEFSISRTAMIDTGNNQALFPNDSFKFAAYFNDVNSDFSGVGSYTFAVPEVSSAGLLGLAALGMHRRRRSL